MLVPEYVCISSFLQIKNQHFRDILDSHDGMITQLYVITRLLRRIDQGDAIDLAAPLHRHARHLLGPLRK